MGFNLPEIRQVNFFDDHPSAQAYSLGQNKFIKSAQNNILVVDGWHFTDVNALNKHQDYIRKIFTPNEKYLIVVNQLKKRCYSECDFIVGVHIRKRDYARFNSVKWFYSNDDYYNFMMQILAFPNLKSRQVGFLLCSDEKIDPDDFKHVKTFISKNNFIEDLHSLAFCDLIIGATSTFSAWHLSIVRSH